MGFRVVQILNYKDDSDKVVNDNTQKEDNNNQGVQNNSTDESYKDENKTDNKHHKEDISNDDNKQNSDMNTPDNGSTDKEDNKNDCGYISNIDYSYDNNNRLTITWDSLEDADTYYVYKYNPATNRISNPKVIMGNTSYTYHRAIANETYFFVITTDKINGRYLNNNADILTISLK